MGLHNKKTKRAARLVVGAAALFALAGSALANLTGSDFDAGDGNLLVDGNPPTETKDWENAPNLSKAKDLATGTSDNSFGQGTKEDTPAPIVTDGSIPNNKSDLTRFYVASDKIGGKDFL